jgi:hypothetical protein
MRVSIKNNSSFFGKGTGLSLSNMNVPDNETAECYQCGEKVNLEDSFCAVCAVTLKCPSDHSNGAVVRFTESDNCCRECGYHRDVNRVFHIRKMCSKLMEHKGLWTLAGYVTMGIVLGYKIHHLSDKTDQLSDEIHQLSDKTDQLSDEIHRLADETYGLNQTIRLRRFR